ncbi:uncharacterized protein [Branchiostoma lanceolatum]|uniref:uncharacterized protein isoform X2 n=1 Tax=Branchiostoma lanceolatum TaxID=7740 RepID=UPI0034559D97
MANRSSNLAEESAAKPKIIHHDRNSKPTPYLIENSSSFGGCLIQRYNKNGPSRKAFRTKQVSNQNIDDAKILVHIFNSDQPGQGTYAVLQFEESEMYFASNEDKPHMLDLEDPGEFEPEDAEDIRTTADRRVFLMKGVDGAQDIDLEAALKGGADLLFASCVASQQKLYDKRKAHVMTLLKSRKVPVRFRREGKGPNLESQYFQLDPANLPEGDSEQFDEHLVQEVQLHD